MEHVRYVHAADGQRLALTLVERRKGFYANAPAFLLIHGFAQNRGAFFGGPIPELLAERGANVLIGELRGHGRSALHGAPYRHTLSTHLEVDLPALIDHARELTGAARVHFVGHSMGGMLGYALLARPHAKALASVTTFAAPVVLGTDRPLVRLAALAAIPALRAIDPGHVPMDWFLKSLAPILCDPRPRGAVRAFQRLTRLVHPRGANPELLEEILASSERESPAVFGELVRVALSGRPVIAGVDLEEAVRATELPVAAVFGRGDIFTARRGLAVLEDPNARGPRMVLELPEALHVDVTCGPEAPRLVAKIWDFALHA